MSQFMLARGDRLPSTRDKRKARRENGGSLQLPL